MHTQGLQMWQQPSASLLVQQNIAITSLNLISASLAHPTSSNYTRHQRSIDRPNGHQTALLQRWQGLPEPASELDQRLLCIPHCLQMRQAAVFNHTCRATQCCDGAVARWQQVLSQHGMGDAAGAVLPALWRPVRRSQRQRGGCECPVQLGKQPCC